MNHRLPPLGSFSRRHFLHGLAAGAVGASLAPHAAATGMLERVASPAFTNEPRALVILHLAGGFDAHELIVPLDDPDYIRLRPTLALDRSQCIPGARGQILNRAAAALAPLCATGQVAILRGVGCADCSPSHFRASEMWHTGSGGLDVEASGWLGRRRVYNDDATRGLKFFHATRTVPRLFASGSAVEATAGAGRWSSPEVPSVPLASAGAPLASILTEIAERVGRSSDREVYFVAAPGFDTHFGQASIYPRLLRELSNALADFQNRIAQRGVASRVLTFAFSEFDRTLTENHQGGTDHAAHSTVFLLGEKLRIGLGATHREIPRVGYIEPEKTALIDFRSVQNALATDWLELRDAPGEALRHPRYELFQA